MKIKILIVAALVLFFIKFAFFNRDAPPIVVACPPATAPFPSYAPEFAPGERWCRENPSEEIFQLSQNYGEARENPFEPLPWKQIARNRDDIKKYWREYLSAILNYAYEGNLETNWIVQKNTKRRWFHAPWMHNGSTGREFLHGLTVERPSCAAELVKGKICDDDKLAIQNWAVSVYNEPGGFYIGQVWNEMLKPQPNPANFPENGFPEGTVAVKLLFTQSEPDYAKNSVVWKADLYRGKMPPQQMRLLQIDVAVRDDNSPTGWVFGTFLYHDDAPPMSYSAALADNQTGWLRVIPLGLMFGNETNESVLNENVPVPQHFGCGRRLNGPVDNPKSSCLACHALAEIPLDLNFEKLNDSYPPMSCDAATNNFWFRHINPRGEKAEEKTLSAPDKRVVPLDFSMQLRQGIERCCLAKNACRCQ